MRGTAQDSLAARQKAKEIQSLSAFGSKPSERFETEHNAKLHGNDASRRAKSVQSVRCMFDALQNCDAKERKRRKRIQRKQARDTLKACRRFLRDHPNAPGDAIWSDCEPTSAPTIKREATPVADDDDPKVADDVAYGGHRHTGPPPGRENAASTGGGRGALQNGIGGKTRNHGKAFTGTKGRRQESTSLIAVNDGRRLCGYVRGRLAYDSDLHELGVFKTQAAAMVRVLDCARIGEKGAVRS